MLAGSAWAYASDPAADRPRPPAGAPDRGGPRARQARDLHPQRPRAPGARAWTGWRPAATRYPTTASACSWPGSTRSAWPPSGRPTRSTPARGTRGSRPRCGPCSTRLPAPAGPVTVTGEIAWRRRPALYREHALFVTVSPDQAREQLACGARVIMVTGEQAALREQIAAARGRAAADRRPRRSGSCGRSSPRTRPRCGWPALARAGRAARSPGHRAADRGAGPRRRRGRGRRPGRRPAPAAARARRARRGGRRPGRGVRRACRATRSPRPWATWPGGARRSRRSPGAGVGCRFRLGSGWRGRRARARRGWRRGRPTASTTTSYLLDLACARECAQADAVGFAGGQLRVRDLARPGAGPAGVLQPGRPRGDRPRSTALLCSAKELSALTTRALVYGDIDLNLIDGSAIWLQSVTQALAAAGCAVTLVLKAPVRTSRLIAPLLAEPGVTVRRPFEEHLLEGPGPVPAAAAPDLLARLDAEAPPRPGGAARPGGHRRGGEERRVRRAAVAVPDRRPAVGPRAHARGGRGTRDDRLGRALPALPDRGTPLLPGGQHPRGLRQVRAAAADPGRDPRRPGARPRPGPRCGWSTPASSRRAGTRWR